MLVFMDRHYNTTGVWHVGEPLPPMARVQLMQADGHELEALQLAMNRCTVGPGGRVVFEYHPPTGYHLVHESAVRDKAGRLKGTPE